jgi:hypothetical protein
MISKLYRRALLALRRFYSSDTQEMLTRRWLAQAKALMADAERMSPVPLGADENSA